MILCSQKSIKLNDRNHKGCTPLLHAIEAKQYQFAKLLLDKKCDTKITTSSSMNVFHLAVQVGDLSYLQLLHSYIPDKSHYFSEKNGDGYTPLHLAVLQHNVSVAEWLLQQGASPDCVDKQHETPLFIACSRGDEVMVKLLLSKGAAVEAKNSSNSTLLTITLAKRYGRVMC